MTLIMTSTCGFAVKENGIRYAVKMPDKNHFLDLLKDYWIKFARILFIASDPDDYIKNDMMADIFYQSVKLTGLSAVSITPCDHRNMDIIKEMHSFDVVILCGGHVPTQNRFFEELKLKDVILDFSGLILSWSAGSMNCAKTVYALPEEDEEAIDPSYERFITGLCLTDTMIIPHFQDVRDDILDGYHVIDDLAMADSVGKSFVCLNDGSFILSEDAWSFFMVRLMKYLMATSEKSVTTIII